MARIKKILVTTDFSDLSRRAFPWARMLAQTFEARVLLVYVEEDRLPPLAGDLSGVQLQQILDAHRKRAEEELRRMAAADFPGGIAVETRVPTGVPHREIVRLAREEGVDLIVMATHGRGFLAHALFGSTTERVLRHAPCPVLTMRAPEEA